MNDTYAELVCASCGAVFSIDEPRWGCLCGGLLDIAFRKPPAAAVKPTAENIKRLRVALPLIHESAWVSLGEQTTPLLPFDVNGRPVYLKLDYLLPTGSFKDRGAALLVSKMKQLGVDQAVEDSSGNAGAAVAAYCARAGITCDIYVPESAPTAKLLQIEAVGARLVRVRGSREDTARAAMAAAEGAYYASHARNPFFLHGIKTCAYELFEQMGEAPERIVVPVGNGTLVLGLYLGFKELSEAGLISRMPRLVAVQAQACAPLARAYAVGAASPVPIEKSATAADGIAVAQPIRGPQILEAVRRTGGSVLSVDEFEIFRALTELHHSGFYVEPTSAVALAGFRRLPHEGDEKTVIVLTGHGLKRQFG